jgi:hypothetical protein
MTVAQQLDKQWGRKVTLLVGGGDSAIDLSELRIKFMVRQMDMESPNTLDARIYNLSEATIKKITEGAGGVEFTRVILQAGYQGASYGAIFDGTIKQFRKGRENATDTYLDILAASNDIEYNFGVCCTTLAAGSSSADRIKAISGQMGLGVLGVNPPRKPTQADVAAQQAKVDAAKAALDAQVAKNFQLIDKANAIFAQYEKTPTPDLRQQLIAAQADMNNANAEAHAIQEPAYNQALADLKAIADAANAPDLPGFPDGGTLPRGKVLFGMGYTNMRIQAANMGATWSIQDGQIVIVPLSGYLPGEAVVLSSLTGMIGVPEQTQQGIKVRCLINPKIRIAGLVQIDNASINQISQAELSARGFPGQLPFDRWAGTPQLYADVTSDGFYRVHVIEYTGDTRGQEWYADIICLAVDKSSNKVLAQ